MAWYALTEDMYLVWWMMVIMSKRLNKYLFASVSIQTVKKQTLPIEYVEHKVNDKSHYTV